ncbi:glycosyltransferase family 39 protein [Microbacterium sp. cx-55]|uniref:ArnT family glycosyltransferase n=1 Tax=Microbacterium sp. cx-55 TaxID=2875948 RepID=UPI001CBD26B9|nr:glycosyltransferase family 39 protein [Microbacterium sp. cx-55]UGB34056.1 glycosyltransferase family 39 protein [Microbacterium sp. cx-55]
MTTVDTPLSPPVSIRNPKRLAWPIGLLSLSGIAVVLTAWNVSGSMSEYYGAIALSMSQSWSNFFFGAFDPAGTVTLDKIPGSFWIPALFVRAFGFSPAIVIVPNALAASAAAVVTAITARRLAGTGAGLFAGAIVATTPILVAVARSNQPQSFFVLALALVAWASVRAIQRASLRWYLVAGLLIAVAFQTYMLEAWAVWPALAAAYLCTRQSWWRRIWHTAVAGALSLVASLTWVAIVWLIPASARPYVGGTNSNNPWEMVFGYNGLGRFTASADSTDYRSFTPPFSGDPGALRLVNEQLAGQIAWLLPAALLAIVVLAVLRFRSALVVFLGVWFVTFAAMFSVVAGMHQFYTSALAIPVALLVGTAFFVARARRVLWAQLALLATAAVTAVAVAAMYTDPTPVLAGVQAAIAVVALVALVVEHRRRVARTATVVLVLIGMLFAPAAWSALTIAAPSSINPTAAGVAVMSVGGGAGSGGFGGGSGSGAPGAGGSGPGAAPGAGSGARAPGGSAPGGSAPNGGMRGGSSARDGGSSTTGRTPFSSVEAGSDGELIDYLVAHQDGASYLVATFGAQAAASLIIDSGGESVLPIGGFGGSDSVPTLEEFQQMVAAGEVVYVLGSATGGFGGGSSSSTTEAISAWVQENCAVVSDAPGTATLSSCAAVDADRPAS